MLIHGFKKNEVIQMSLTSKKREGLKMKALKILFVLFCLLAYAWAFSQPIHAQSVQPVWASSQISASPVGSLPFKMLIERNCPLYADRQMTLKIAEIPAGYNVVTLEKYDLQGSQGTVVLRVAYADGKGTQYTGWVSGTLNVKVPH